MHSHRCRMDNVETAHKGVESKYKTYYDNILKGYGAKVPLCWVIQLDCEDWTGKSYIH